MKPVYGAEALLNCLLVAHLQCQRASRPLKEDNLDFDIGTGKGVLGTWCGKAVLRAMHA